MGNEAFAQRVLDWFDVSGRTDLPWQRDPTPYRVWVSEIMLQQTRVATVIPYYERFMQRFPDLQALAQADIDQVLHYWTGLGYYARGRNLHKAARHILSEHDGCFPQRFDDVLALPGVGRSTAAAILALSAGQRHAILDGNVKRVLARHELVDGWTGQASVQKKLWESAERYTPDVRVADYTQAIMDLGATVCTCSQPECTACPLTVSCQAFLQQRQTEFPVPRPRRQLPVRSVTMLMLANERQEVLLVKRPPAGIWGGLWGFPELDMDESVADWCHRILDLQLQSSARWQVLRHTFSHFHLDITPVHAEVAVANARIMEGGDGLWYKPGSSDEKGFAAPVVKLMRRLENHTPGQPT